MYKASLYARLINSYDSNHIMRASNPLKAPSSPLADNSDESIHQSCPLAENLNLLRHSEFSSVENSNFLRQFEFSAAENSKCGELEAGNSMRGTRYLPISYKVQQRCKRIQLQLQYDVTSQNEFIDIVINLIITLKYQTGANTIFRF